MEEVEILPTIRNGLSAGRKHPRRVNCLKTENGKAPAREDDQTSDVTRKLSELGENDTDNASRFATRYADRIRRSNSRSSTSTTAVRLRFCSAGTLDGITQASSSKSPSRMASRSSRITLSSFCRSCVLRRISPAIVQRPPEEWPLPAAPERSGGAGQMLAGERE